MRVGRAASLRGVISAALMARVSSAARPARQRHFRIIGDLIEAAVRNNIAGVNNYETTHLSSSSSSICVTSTTATYTQTDTREQTHIESQQMRKIFT